MKTVKSIFPILALCFVVGFTSCKNKEEVKPPVVHENMLIGTWNSTSFTVKVETSSAPTTILIQEIINKYTKDASATFTFRDDETVTAVLALSGTGSGQTITGNYTYTDSEIVITDTTSGVSIPISYSLNGNTMNAQFDIDSDLTKAITDLVAQYLNGATITSIKGNAVLTR